MSTQKSGVITIETAGAAVAGPNISGGFLLQAARGNTGTYCYAGDDGDGDVADSNGYTLEKSSNQVPYIGNLSHLLFDTDTNGDGVEWFLVESLGTPTGAVPA